MRDVFAEDLQAALEAKVALAPPRPNLPLVLRRGIIRRRRNRAAAVAGAVTLAASGLALPQLDLSSRLRPPDRVAITAGVERVGRMTVPRAAHAATLLQDGRVLLSGGFSGDTEVYYDSAEIFDPVTRTFLPTSPMSTPRTGHASVLLDDGTVLVAGGWGNDFLSSAELYDPALGLFEPTGPMGAKRDGFTATKLRDGRVLIVGGYRSGYDTFHRSTEIYDPSTGAFTPAGNLRRARASHTATLLRDGRVVVAGGLGPNGVVGSIEIFDPETGTFSEGGTMTTARQKHGAVLLDTGDVLLVGGADIEDSFGRYRSAEVYDPAAGTSRSVGRMAFARFKIPSPVNLPATRKVFVAGGADTAEVYRERRRSFVPVEGALVGAQLFPTATMLRDGSVLVTGGYDDDIQATDGAWLYTAP
ncbi:MAG TPA: kelch repeat-containing protein [Actinomycetota bacterium]|nr:kelch repeat-containing protein [Actinomycetota bacterium]